MHVGNFLFTHFTKGDQHWVVLTLFLQRQDRDIDICSNGIIQNTVKWYQWPLDLMLKRKKKITDPRTWFVTELCLLFVFLVDVVERFAYRWDVDSNIKILKMFGGRMKRNISLPSVQEELGICCWSAVWHFRHLCKIRSSWSCGHLGVM